MAQYINANSVNIQTSVFTNNQNITSIDCNNVPWTNNDMANAFFNCVKLTSIANVSDSTTNMFQAFKNCKALTSAPTIPNSVTNMYYAFHYCYNLLTGPTIPSSVQSANYAFSYCVNMTSIPSIENSVTYMYGTFSQCRKLTSVPTIPDSVSHMSKTFENCWLLETAPNIGTGVQFIDLCFNNCQTLTGNIYIHSNQIVNAMNCFNSSSAIKNVYIPFTYENSETSATYNSFISAGYTTTGTKEGVYLKDINGNTVPVAINIINGTGDVTIAGNTYTTNGTYNIPVGEQTVTVAGTASTQFYLSSGSAVQLAALGVNTCTLNFVSSSQVTTSYSGSAINVALPLSLMWWNKDK